MLELSIVIPVFNCLALTQACLKSLEETIGGRTDFEVIVVDNASTDGTAEWLATLPAPRYRILRHERNLGYAAANNAAARLAGGRLLLLLNNDTVLLPGWLEPMLRVLAHAEKAGLVGNIQREAESGLIDHAGVLFTAEGVPRHFGKDLGRAPAPGIPALPRGHRRMLSAAPRSFSAVGRIQRGISKRLRGRGLLPPAAAGGALLLRRESQRHLPSRQRDRRPPPGRCRQFRAAFRIVAAADSAAGRGIAGHRGPAARLAIAGGGGGTHPARAAPRWLALRQKTLLAPVELQRRPTAPGGQWHPRAPVRAARGARALFLRVTRPPYIYVVAGDTARNPSRSGIPTTVRSLVRELAGRQAERARVAFWNRHRHCLHLLPKEYSLGLAAEALRDSPVLAVARKNPGVSQLVPRPGGRAHRLASSSRACAAS